MSEMIDRVAEAIRLRGCERGYPISPMVVHHLAAAAIEAMREPTEAMADAGTTETNSEEDAIECWNAMINEAMK